MAVSCRSRGILRTLSLFGALVSLPALPQEVHDPNQLTEIVVTAQKRSQSINDVGMTIQAAPANSLLDRGIQGPEDLEKLVAGFTATKSIYETPVFTLRGIGLYDATFAAPPAVAVYTDQIPRNFPVMSGALDLDLERVEVLKGPQGTLFGQSSTGGAINYITAKPTDQFAAGFNVSDERFDKRTIEAFVSGPITDTLSARFALRSVEGGAWQYSQSRPDDENGATRKLEGRLTIDWKPVDRLSLETSLTAVRDQSDPQAPQYVGSILDTYSTASLAAADANPATRNPYGIVNNAVYAGLTTPGSPNYSSSFLSRQTTLANRLNGSDSAVAAGARALLGTPLETNNARAAEWTPGLLGPSDNSYFQGTLRADYKLNDDITLTSLTAFAHQKLDYDQDLDATVAQGADVPIFGTVSTFNQELHLSGAMSDLNWIVGASYDHDESRQSNDYLLGDYSANTPIPGIPNIATTLNNYSSSLKTYAEFANVEYKVTSSLTASAGVRYTRNDTSASYCYNDPASDTVQGAAGVFSIFQNLFTGSTLPAIKPGQCFPLGDGLSGTTSGKATLTPVDRTLDQGNTSFRVGLDYKLDHGTLLYATVSQGYKAGFFSAIGASTTSQYAPAVQEKVIAYETGFKAPFLDHRLNLNGAAFYYDYSNKQVRGDVLDPVYGLLEKMINVPKSYVWGIEGELVARPIDGLTVSASGTYLRSEVSQPFSKTLDGTAVYNAEGYTGNFQGSALPFTPKFSANADAQYDLNIGRSWVPFIGGNVFFQSSENTTFANSILLAPDFDIPSYATLDLRAGLHSEDHKWQLTVYGRNVTNKVYDTSITSYLDTRFRLTGEPAIYGVAFRMNFN
jgi:iron complex outermembrane recepter protein